MIPANAGNLACGKEIDRCDIFPGHAEGTITPYGGSFSARGPKTFRINRYTTELMVKMFKADDPQGANAVDARTILANAPKQ